MIDRSTEPIGIIVERYRDEQDLRQSDLAAMMEVDPSTVSRLEKRLHFECLDPQSIPSVEAFARVIGKSPEYFREYRAWRCEQIMKAHPDLVDQAYDLLVAQAEAEEVKETKGGHVG